jgi:hypothetical protein
MGRTQGGVELKDSSAVNQAVPTKQSTQTTTPKGVYTPKYKNAAGGASEMSQILGTAMSMGQQSRGCEEHALPDPGTTSHLPIPPTEEVAAAGIGFPSDPKQPGEEPTPRGGAPRRTVPAQTAQPMSGVAQISMSPS